MTELEEPESEDEMWSCPKHGDDNLRTLTSEMGQTYRTCKENNCWEFERLPEGQVAEGLPVGRGYLGGKLLEFASDRLVFGDEHFEHYMHAGLWRRSEINYPPHPGKQKDCDRHHVEGSGRGGLKLSYEDAIALWRDRPNKGATR